ncbi:MAG: 1-acyl-sn-glycerol-3-phosphate acyltransferase [Alphaproteobacteria bacterium]
MGGVVELPLWVVVLGTAFAVVALVDRVVGPSVRWFFRKRFHRAIDEINERLQLKIQPFKLTERRVLIERLVYDVQVQEAVEARMAESGEPRGVVMARVERYAREIVPSFSAITYFAVGARVARLIAQSLYRVRLGAFDEAALERVDREATVVFVINHRSNADYLLVTYLASTRSALSYAVGEWARVWPLNRIIRNMGAYFIRRRSRDALYRRVLARYVRMATDAGVTQAIFPEGGLSRDGRPAPPKLGLLSYIVTGFDPDGRDVVFIPVGLNYDRVLEDRVLIGTSVSDGTLRFPVNIWTTAAFVMKLVWRRFTGRYYRFGYAVVGFGEPLSLKEFLARPPGGDTVAELGAELSVRIGRVIPVLPVSLVASVFVAAGAPLSMAEVRAEAAGLLERLHAAGAHAHIPRASLDYAVEVGIRMLTLRGIVTEAEGLYAVAPGEAGLLRYYANSIAHLLPEAAA